MNDREYPMDHRIRVIHARLTAVLRGMTDFSPRHDRVQSVRAETANGRAQVASAAQRRDMTTTHHPSDETLGAYASLGLDRARSLVVAAHLEACGICRLWTERLRSIGGILLEDLPPSELPADALPRTLARLAAQGQTSKPGRREPNAVLPDGLPRCLNGLDVAAWRWVAPGIRTRAIRLPENDGARLFLLKVAPGMQLPHHTHSGSELTQILSGAFRHEGGRFAAGDCDDADDSVEHQPVVEAGEPCVCLVAMEGTLRLSGILGRIMQPFVRL